MHSFIGLVFYAVPKNISLVRQRPALGGEEIGQCRGGGGIHYRLQDFDGPIA